MIQLCLKNHSSPCDTEVPWLERVDPRRLGRAVITEINICYSGEQQPGGREQARGRRQPPLHTLPGATVLFRVATKLPWCSVGHRSFLPQVVYNFKRGLKGQGGEEGFYYVVNCTILLTAGGMRAECPCTVLNGIGIVARP